jgi:hypothetical protein
VGKAFYFIKTGFFLKSKGEDINKNSFSHNKIKNTAPMK